MQHVQKHLKMDRTYSILINATNFNQFNNFFTCKHFECMTCLYVSCVGEEMWLNGILLLYERILDGFHAVSWTNEHNCCSPAYH